MAGKPHVDEPSVLDRIPMTFRDYPGEVEPTESVLVSAVHLDPLPAPEAAKPAKKEN